jgi:N-acetylglutamate synthase-like GNAT family acetyltransferase
MPATIDTTEIAIRPAGASDYASVERLLQASSLPTDGVREALHDFFVATVNDRVVGVVGMEYCCEYGLLRSTAVEAEWRGHHVAKRLVERIIAEAESRGVHALYLLTTTAERYFPSFGFTVTSRDTVPAPIRETGEFKGACPASATVMTLGLSTTPAA